LHSAIVHDYQFTKNLKIGKTFCFVFDVSSRKQLKNNANAEANSCQPKAKNHTTAPLERLMKAKPNGAF
jgi:hypothetical protein